MLADLIVVVTVAFCIIMGYRSGFVKTCIRAVSYVLSIILALAIYPVVAGFLATTPLYDFLLGVVEANVVGTGDVSLGLYAEYFKDAAQMLATGATEAIATLLINIIAFVLVVIGCRIIIALLANMLNLVTKIRGIKQLNQLGGIVIGALIGVLVVYIVLAVLLFCEPMLESDFVIEQIQNSMIASKMYQNNVLVSMLSDAAK
ncbi:MAG: CvpA family protein [Clostridia bacterium]|nr:CvpA family protein [Clostridia bacterium]